MSSGVLGCLYGLRRRRESANAADYISDEIRSDWKVNREELIALWKFGSYTAADIFVRPQNRDQPPDPPQEYLARHSRRSDDTEHERTNLISHPPNRDCRLNNKNIDSSVL